MSTRRHPRFCGVCEQLVVLVAEHHEDHGYAPSIREMRDATGLASTSTVDHHLRQLQAAGRIAREPRLRRTIRVIIQGARR